MDTEPQVSEAGDRVLLIIDRVVSFILLAVLPFVAVAQLLFVALGTSHWMDGTLVIPHWAATTAAILICLVPLAAAIATLVLLAKHRFAFWVPLTSMMLTSIMVAALGAYDRSHQAV